ncbi:hypothetical protein M099_1355 [Phocaeicola vulgatus str. 3975 RP4]|uniref:Uncharacterized protein n=2 Tax=Phocaeicola vulgatus TaxID=821 RepID=A0A078R903_PHOVU|nr:hypothetical protein M098_1980 [Phocaeicola vulgatus str. 3775 SR(B) 19]KDS31116.1 hypothetical protein M097_2314 [Phocaeicola vulgatus str. 3775 SL(B) 10 (iv)]KDS55152.1 hypothetical protein M099_1355 [Phocaeicola vulgatus str. 3975 RP4]
MQKELSAFLCTIRTFFHLKAGKPAILSSYFTSLAFFFFLANYLTIIK